MCGAEGGGEEVRERGVRNKIFKGIQRFSILFFKRLFSLLCFYINTQPHVRN